MFNKSASSTAEEMSGCLREREKRMGMGVGAGVILLIIHWAVLYCSEGQCSEVQFSVVQCRKVYFCLL